MNYTHHDGPTLTRWGFATTPADAPPAPPREPLSDAEIVRLNGHYLDVAYYTREAFLAIPERRRSLMTLVGGGINGGIFVLTRLTEIPPETPMEEAVAIWEASRC